MKAIQRDVARLMPAPNAWALLDGLLLGAVVGAGAAVLVVVVRAATARRYTRPLAGSARGPYLPGSESSPL
jgi:hypothetical protein